MKELEYDVVIVGAGLAGAALAVALSELPLRIAVVEAQSLSSGWPDIDEGVAAYDARVSALTPASQALLEELGVWQEITRRRVSPYTEMQVWDGEGTGSIHFSADEVGRSVLGHIVENRLVNAALLEKLRFNSRVQLLDASPVAEWRRSIEGPELLLEDGRVLLAPLVVAADGANSRIRGWAGFETREWDYGQKAIVATLEMQQSHKQTARQSFLRTGPLAFLPLSDAQGSDRFCSIVWSADEAEADRLMALGDEAFCQQLAAAFEYRLGAVQAISRRFCFPLRQRHAVHYVQPGVALIGDAAHSIHPLAGQGINLGFQDVRVLAEELTRAHQRGLPLSDLAVLDRYQRRRKGDNLGMMAVMEGFKRLFGESALPLRWLRNTGMSLLDGAAPVKRQLIRRAMGL